jgi:thiol:disulfide interchange protein DsbD
MGLVVLGFAIWTLRYILPAWASLSLWSLVAFVGAAVLGAFRPAESLPAGIARGLGILALAAGVLSGLRGVEGFTGVDLLPKGGAATRAEAPEWRKAWMEQDLEKALARAKAEGKVVLVDIYAEWCAQCHELDEKTWPDAGIQAWISANAVAIRIDTDKVRPDLAAQLGIRSYPTVLLLDADGRELRRILGFRKAAELRSWLG